MSTRTPLSDQVAELHARLEAVRAVRNTISTVANLGKPIHPRIAAGWRARLTALLQPVAADRAEFGALEVTRTYDPPGYSARFRHSGDWGRYPLGTIAYSINGGHWTRTGGGWKWHCGSTFPTPGGDAFDVSVPAAIATAREPVTS